MRILVALTAVAAVLATGTVGATSAGASTLTRTQRVVVRPVTAYGHPVSGFHVRIERSGQVDCSFPEPSPGAVDKNILLCSPSAEYAIACWKSSTPHHALCMRNPRVDKLVKIPTTGRFAHTAAPRHKVPLALRLANGVYCTIRDGGAGARLRHHPNWAATYYCANGAAVWARIGSRSYGVDTSHRVWTVHTAPASGKGSLVVRKVMRAWFVGTRH